MSGFFRHAPIRSKLRFIILSTCIVSLLVACATLFAVQFYFFRKTFIQDMKSTAEMIAAQSIGAVDFESRTVGAEIIGTLSAKVGITGAALFLKTGAELATFGRMDARLTGRSRSAAPQQWWEGGDLYFEP